MSNDQKPPVKKDADYHLSAIKYNDEIAAFADELAEDLENEEVARWSRAVAKQHRFHSGRHKKSLRKLQNKEQGAVENTEDGSEGRALDVDGSIADEQREFAAAQKEN